MIGGYASSLYAPVTRHLTPKEQQIAEDNDRVKAIGGKIKFHAPTISYFYPDMPQSEHPKDTAEIGGKTHYRNVRDVVDAAQRALMTKAMPERVMRNGLNMCFKGTAVL